MCQSPLVVNHLKSVVNVMKKEIEGRAKENKRSRVTQSQINGNGCIFLPKTLGALQSQTPPANKAANAEPCNANG